MRFRDRRHAGKELAAKLSHYANKAEVVVLGLPRGGVVIGDEVARAIDAPLDIFMVRKMGMPGQEELAIGAIATGGTRVLNYHVVQTYDVSPSTIDEIAEREHRELLRRENAYRSGRLPLNVRGKTVIVVDDGLATGATMRAAVSALEKHHPTARIVAVPVASMHGYDDIGAVVDEIVCLETPSEFESIGQFYDDFSETTDEDVTAILSRSKAP